MSDWSIINAPQTVAATSATLQAAINAATPGTIVEVATAGDPVSITLSGVKAGYGVCIKLPPDQLIHPIISGSGYHFFGGKFSGDLVVGGTAQTNNGVRILAGASKVSIHGALFDMNQNAVQATDATDIWLRGVRAEVCRADGFNFVNTSRIKIEGCATGPGARGEKLCYYNDGRAPVENISQGTCTAGGGLWEDTSHNDGVQARNTCYDVDIIGNTLNGFEAQGIVSFGSPDSLIYRARVVQNTMPSVGSNGIFLSGGDIECRDNALTPAPGASAISTISRDGAGRIFGGRNSGGTWNSPSGVDMVSASLNGDAGVVAPAAPQIILPPWAPAVPTPPARSVAAPLYIAGGGIRVGGFAWNAVPVSVSVGAWLTLNRGSFADTEGVTWEYRWKRDGTVISGATAQTYQTVSADVGATVTAEVRGTNAQGSGSWATYPGIPVV